MPNRIYDYGSVTPFALASNLNSLGNNEAKPLGVVDNSSLRAPYFLLQFDITLPSSSVSSTGSIEFWLLSANVNSVAGDWTDGIAPTGTSNIAGSLRNAILIHIATANSISAVIRPRIELGIRAPFPFWTLVPFNKCGNALPSSGHSASWRPVSDLF